VRAAFVVVSVLVSSAGCDSGGTECLCPSAGLTVNLPDTLAAKVVSITPSGLACSDAGIVPTPGPSTSSTYRIAPAQPGQCQIDIQFSDGTTFSDELTVVETTGCCAGLHTAPTGAAEIDVPAPEDAGG